MSLSLSKILLTTGKKNQTEEPLAKFKMKIFPLKNGEKYIPNMDGLRFLNTDAFTTLKALRLRMTQSQHSHLLREIETMSRVGLGIL